MSFMQILIYVATLKGTVCQADNPKSEPVLPLTHCVKYGKYVPPHIFVTFRTTENQANKSISLHKFRFSAY